MKAEVSNSFEIGSFSFTTTTALYARKHESAWLVHLNHHKITCRYLESEQNKDGNIIILNGSGLTLQSNRNLDVVSGFCLILGSVGVIQSIIDTVRKVLEILADVRSLVPKVLEWLKDELIKVLTDEEPAYRTRLEQAQFVLNLIKDGASFERRLPRWREKPKLGME